MKNNIIVAIQVIPKNPEHITTYDIVDRAIEVIQKSGLKYVVGPMETTMEGQLDDCLNVIKKIQGVCINAGATSLLSMIKIHYQPEGSSIEDKIHKYKN